MEDFLKPNEEIEKIVSKKKYLPLRNEDWIKIPMLIFFIFFSFLFTDNWNLTNNFNLFLIPFLITFFVFIFKVTINYYKRIRNAYYWKLIITNERFIVTDEKSRILQEYYFSNFPEMTYEENAYGNGCLIFGETEPLFGVSKSIFRISVGVNFEENNNILYNIESIKKVFNEINSKITSPNTSLAK